MKKKLPVAVSFEVGQPIPFSFAAKKKGPWPSMAAERIFPAFVCEMGMEGTLRTIRGRETVELQEIVPRSLEGLREECKIERKTLSEAGAKNCVI